MDRQVIIVGILILLVCAGAFIGGMNFRNQFCTLEKNDLIKYYNPIFYQNDTNFNNEVYLQNLTAVDYLT